MIVEESPFMSRGSVKNRRSLLTAENVMLVKVSAMIDTQLVCLKNLNSE